MQSLFLDIILDFNLNLDFILDLIFSFIQIGFLSLHDIVLFKTKFPEAATSGVLRKRCS